MPYIASARLSYEVQVDSQENDNKILSSERKSWGRQWVVEPGVRRTIRVIFIRKDRIIPGPKSRRRLNRSPSTGPQSLHEIFRLNQCRTCIELTTSHRHRKLAQMTWNLPSMFLGNHVACKWIQWTLPPSVFYYLRTYHFACQLESTFCKSIGKAATFVVMCSVDGYLWLT